MLRKSISLIVMIILVIVILTSAFSYTPIFAYKTSIGVKVDPVQIYHLVSEGNETFIVIHNPYGNIAYVNYANITYPINPYSTLQFPFLNNVHYFTLYEGNLVEIIEITQ
ncbi:hypothetical protein HFC64_16320 [Saccharolobus solfataricus]|uniref:Uncharacterized protein n=1 Tax=Saccharolobus solfataricus TaxID=2287 RepID=A0A7S9IL96_SACSO|nr:hypothetical protein [Saccharolobus solfataricus]QPG51180.1 hypothetical protein HFC64_16320 [Saccharolobus solfataricus]